MKNIKDPELQKAEIAQFNSDYEEASKMFEKNNRNDLKLNMLMKLGKWQQVSEMMDKDKNPGCHDNSSSQHLMGVLYVRLY